ncbi:MAG: hypothetical protein K2N28_02705 [Muribaculaceae bacterium]|nr:hypothetical protein [Muribaculaceae bacterium]
MKHFLSIILIIISLSIAGCNSAKHIVSNPVVAAYDITYDIHYPNKTTTKIQHINYAYTVKEGAHNGVNYIIGTNETDNPLTLYSSTAPYEIRSITSHEYPRIFYKEDGRYYESSVIEISKEKAFELHKQGQKIIYQNQKGDYNIWEKFSYVNHNKVISYYLLLDNIASIQAVN